MNFRDERTRSRAKAAARTITTIVIALTSTVVIALAGCADSSGIGTAAQLVPPASVGVPATPSAAPAPAIAADWWRGFDDAGARATWSKRPSPGRRACASPGRAIAKAAANAGVAPFRAGPAGQRRIRSQPRSW